MMRILLSLLMTLLALLLLVIVTITTPLGLKASLFIGKKIVPGELTYQKSRGVLIGPLTIDNLQYRHDGELIKIKRLTLQWRLMALVFGHLDIAKLSVNTVNITLPKKPSAKMDSLKQVQQTIHSFKLPFSLKIDEGTFDNVSYGSVANEFPYHIKRLTVTGDMNKSQLNLDVNANFTKPYPTQIRLLLKGIPSDYQLTLFAKNHFYNFKINGSGSDKKINLITSESDTFGGKISGAMTIFWQPTFAWNLSLNASKLNLSRIDSRLPQQLNGSIESKGSLKNSTPLFDLIAHLKTNRDMINLNVHHHSTWNAKWNLNIAQLSQFLPAYSGAIISQGDLASHQASQFSIKAKNLKLANQLIKSADINANGTFTHHTMTGSIVTENAKLKVNWTGNWQEKAYQAKLNSFTINDNQLGQWRLSKKAHLNITEKTINLSQLCLYSSNRGTLCGDINWQQGAAWRATLKGSNINVTGFTHKINPSLNISGRMNMAGELNGRDKTLERANLTMRLLPGTLTYSVANKTLRNRYTSGNLTASFDASKKTGLKTSMRFNFQRNNYLALAFNMPDYHGVGFPAKSNKIQGKVDTNLNSIGALSAFLPNIAIAKGTLITNLNLSGTLEKPSVQGHAVLKNGNILIQRLNLTLTNVDISLQAKPKGLGFTAKALSGTQPITFTGESTFSSKGIITHAKVTGDNVLISNTNEYTLYATPDLTIDINGRKVSVNGTITIPKGLVKPQEFRNVTTLPEGEVVFIGKPKIQKTNPWLYALHIKLIIGDGVKFDAIGVTGNVYGEVDIVSKPGQDILGNGRISINNGKYTAYGNSLNIDPSSYIQFANSPISNPSINIRANKAINVNASSTTTTYVDSQITVGIQVTGNFKDPKIKLYSVPANLSQADILSYLLLGTALNTDATGGGNINLLISALNTAKIGSDGISGAGSIFQNIKKTLNISEFGVETETTLDPIGNPIDQQTSFVVGSHLTKNLYLRYSQALQTSPGLTSVNQLTLRYLISKNWAIQTNSSNLGNGADLLYTITKY